MDKWICSGWHYTFGWLRRPELDEENGGFCYEEPDGDIVISSDPRHLNAMYLDCRWDDDIKETYTALSTLPRIYKGKKRAR
jgi:hypothetical protein